MSKRTSEQEASGFEWLAADKVAIRGTLDEFFDYESLFKAIATSKATPIHVDVAEIHRINSVGVREWVRQILSCPRQILFERCPPVFLDQVNMIPQFIGSGSNVLSFFGIFECVECGDEKPQLYQVGTDIIPGAETYTEPDELTCDNCGSSQSFAHNTDIYFAFLQEKKSAS